MKEKLKRAVKHLDEVKLFYDIITILYFVLIALPSLMSFERFVLGAHDEGIFWAAVALYWIIKAITRSVKNEFQFEEDDEIGDEDDEL